jgi:hypothetical protein
MNNGKRFREHKDTHKGSRCVQKVREGDEQERTPKKVSRPAGNVRKGDEQEETPTRDVPSCSMGVRKRRAQQDIHDGCLVVLRSREKAMSTTGHPHPSWMSCRAQMLALALVMVCGHGCGHVVPVLVDVSTTLLTGQFPSPVCKVELANEMPS